MSEEVDQDPAREEGDKGKRLTPEQWREIEMLWEYGLMKTKDIATKFGISGSAINGHFQELKKKGTPIAKGAKRGEAMRALKVTPPPAPVAPKVASEFESKKKDRIEQARELMHRASRFTLVSANQVYAQIHAGTMTWVSAASMLKSIKMAGHINELNATNIRSSLDMATEIDESSMPILEIDDLTAQEVEVIRNKGDEDDLDGLNLLVEDEDDDIIEEGKPSP